MKDKIYMIRTNNVCFITECTAEQGSYDYSYHIPKLIPKLLFDGKEAMKSDMYKNWFIINNYPIIIKKKAEDRKVNERFELVNPIMENDKLKLKITYEEWQQINDDEIQAYYDYKYEMEPGEYEDFEIDFEILAEIDNFEMAKEFNFKAIRRTDFSDKVYNVTRRNIEHQTFDKLIFPEMLLHARPCRISSDDLYDITRQHIVENIDNRYAKITSNYDFCFEVKKLIPLYTPETVTYSNIFARTKKERNKIRSVVKEFREERLFNMTNERNKQQGYNILEGITANNEDELKDKINEWLESLMIKINMPLKSCECCKGVGYIKEEKGE